MQTQQLLLLFQINDVFLFIFIKYIWKMNKINVINK